MDKFNLKKYLAENKLKENTTAEYLVVNMDGLSDDYFIISNLTLMMSEFYPTELKEYGIEKVKELFFNNYKVFKGINGIEELDKNYDIY